MPTPGFAGSKAMMSVFFSGSDENSLTNVLAAEAEGITTCELVDRNVAYFQEALEAPRLLE
ncbi:MAG: hypothetical protein R2849_14300 [Thermomicrobiales bacterium]